MGKNINADLLLDCYSCAHSQIGIDRKTGHVILICSKTTEKAISKCQEFIYEPGTDQEELLPMFLKKQAE